MLGVVRNGSDVGWDSELRSELSRLVRSRTLNGSDLFGCVSGVTQNGWAWFGVVFDVVFGVFGRVVGRVGTCVWNFVECKQCIVRG